MSVNKNCSTFNFMFRVPDAQVGEVEKVLVSHEAWMRGFSAQPRVRVGFLLPVSADEK